MENDIGQDVERVVREDEDLITQFRTDEIEDQGCIMGNDKLVNDSKKLRVHLHREEQASKAVNSATTSHEEPSELLSLCLGMACNDETTKSSTGTEKKNDRNSGNQGLSLGLQIGFEHGDSKEVIDSSNASSRNSFSRLKEEEPSRICQRRKILKTKQPGYHEITQAQQKRARVSIRTRCDTPMVNDGCQWRKYGQKVAKGNPCPRAYYRCTGSPSCPVRKQVQRCAEDMSIMITTYEGKHDHPVSATALGYATSAAVSMLQSRSLSSTMSALETSAKAPISTSTTTVNGGSLMFPTFQPHQLHFSTSNLSHPTVTLDLTNSPHVASQFRRFSSDINFHSSTVPIGPYSSTCLNFAASSFSSPEPDIRQSSWNGTYGPTSFFNSGTSPFIINRKYINGSGLILNSSTGKQEFQRPNDMINQISMCHMSLTAETIAAATKAIITTTPKLQSAIAAAIMKYVGNVAMDGDGDKINDVGSQACSLDLKLGSDR